MECQPVSGGIIVEPMLWLVAVSLLPFGVGLVLLRRDDPRAHLALCCGHLVVGAWIASRIIIDEGVDFRLFGVSLAVRLLGLALWVRWAVRSWMRYRRATGARPERAPAGV